MEFVFLILCSMIVAGILGRIGIIKWSPHSSKTNIVVDFIIPLGIVLVIALVVLINDLFF